MVMKSVLLQADTINCNLIKRFQSQKSKICTLHEALDRKNCVCDIANGEHKMNECFYIGT